MPPGTTDSDLHPGRTGPAVIDALAVFDALPAAVVIVDGEGRVVAANQPWQRLLTDIGAAAMPLGGDYLHAVAAAARVDAADAEALAEGLRAVQSGERGGFATILAHETPAGHRWLRIDLRPLPQQPGGGLVAMHSDVTERVLADQRLVHLAQYDSLTALPNRTLFRDRLNSALAMARRSERQVAVLFVDLDRFKTINDTLGHAVGDRMLQVVAGRLRDCVREYDTVGRFGGDEFAVSLTQLKDAREAVAGAERIIAAVAESVDLDGETLSVSASVGITLFPGDGDDADILIRNADAAMYRAKELGSNGFQFFTGEMNDRARLALRLDQDLRAAVERQEFVLHYQPKLSCVTGRILGFEALLRWRHPLRGLVAPGEFVPLLEETGLIVPVGEWVLRTACAQLRAWLDAGLGKPSVAVNVAGRQIDEGLCETVRDVLDAFALDASCLELELTESFLMRDAEVSLAILARLKAMGVGISVDDFGTGYSSLAYLKRLPVDALKVDRAFVQDITAEPDDVSITRAVIMLAHSLKLKVVAEGVETEGQLGMLIANQCDEFQGYYFSRPLPADEATALLRDGRGVADRLLARPERARTLLLVDDEAGILSSLRRLLRRDGYTILTAESAEQGLELLGSQAVDVVISDQRMPSMTGVDFLRRVKALHPETVRIVLSGYTDLQSITDAINEGAIYKFLTKPWEDDVLRANIEEAFRTKELGDENRRLNAELRAANSEMARLNERLERLLAEKEKQLVHGQAALGITQDILYGLPWPLIGIDDENMIAFANGAAERLASDGLPLLGSVLGEALPPALREAAGAGEPSAVVEAAGVRYRVHREAMGEGSRGTLLMLVPLEGGH